MAFWLVGFVLLGGRGGIVVVVVAVVNCILYFCLTFLAQFGCCGGQFKIKTPNEGAKTSILVGGHLLTAVSRDKEVTQLTTN